MSKKLYVARDEVGDQDVLLCARKPTVKKTENGLVYWMTEDEGDELLVITDNSIVDIAPGRCFEITALHLGMEID